MGQLRLGEEISPIFLKLCLLDAEISLRHSLHEKICSKFQPLQRHLDGTTWVLRNTAQPVFSGTGLWVPLTALGLPCAYRVSELVAETRQNQIQFLTVNRLHQKSLTKE